MMIQIYVEFFRFYDKSWKVEDLSFIAAHK